MSKRRLTRTGGADGSLQAARGQARIESYEQMLELIDLAKKEGFFDLHV